MENALLKNCLPLDELKQFIILKQQHVKIIDVRSKEEYDQYHIPDAVHLELLNLSAIANELFDKEDILVTACGKGGGRSTQASNILKELGFKNTYWLCGGTQGWS